MAVRINPCFGCALREGCDMREDFRARARQLGGAAIAVGFHCSKLVAALRPGRRIIIRQPTLVPGYHEGERAVRHVEVKATIVSVDSRARFACVVDPGQIEADDCADATKLNTYRFRRRAPHTRIVRVLDEPDATICAADNVRRDGVCDVREGGDCACSPRWGSFNDLQ